MYLTCIDRSGQKGRLLIDVNWFLAVSVFDTAGGREDHRPSASILAAQDNRHRLQQYPKVQREARVGYIPQVMLCSLAEKVQIWKWPTKVVDLSPAGNAGFQQSP